MSTAKQTVSCSSQVTLSLETLLSHMSVYIRFRVAPLQVPAYLQPNSIGRFPGNGYRSRRNYSNKSMEWITYCENITGISYRHPWSVGGELYLKKVKAWTDAYYKSTGHEYVMALMGCHFHGCQTCFDLSKMNTHLNKSMVICIAKL